MSIAVGMVIGGAVGTAAAMLSQPKKSSIKKSANRALHSIGDMVENIAGCIM